MPKTRRDYIEGWLAYSNESADRRDQDDLLDELQRVYQDETIENVEKGFSEDTAGISGSEPEELDASSSYTSFARLSSGHMPDVIASGDEREEADAQLSHIVQRDSGFGIGPSDLQRDIPVEDEKGQPKKNEQNMYARFKQQGIHSPLFSEFVLKSLAEDADEVKDDDIDHDMNAQAELFADFIQMDQVFAAFAQQTNGMERFKEWLKNEGANNTLSAKVLKKYEQTSEENIREMCLDSLRGGMVGLLKDGSTEERQERQNSYNAVMARVNTVKQFRKRLEKIGINKTKREHIEKLFSADYAGLNSKLATRDLRDKLHKMLPKLQADIEKAREHLQNLEQLQECFPKDSADWDTFHDDDHRLGHLQPDRYKRHHLPETIAQEITALNNQITELEAYEELITDSAAQIESTRATSKRTVFSSIDCKLSGEQITDRYADVSLDRIVEQEDDEVSDHALLESKESQSDIRENIQKKIEEIKKNLEGISRPAPAPAAAVIDASDEKHTQVQASMPDQQVRLQNIAFSEDGKQFRGCFAEYPVRPGQPWRSSLILPGTIAADEDKRVDYQQLASLQFKQQQAQQKFDGADKALKEAETRYKKAEEAFEKMEADPPQRFPSTRKRLGMSLDDRKAELKTAEVVKSAAESRKKECEADLNKAKVNFSLASKELNAGVENTKELDQLLKARTLAQAAHAIARRMPTESQPIVIRGKNTMACAYLYRAFRELGVSDKAIIVPGGTKQFAHYIGQSSMRPDRMFTKDGIDSVGVEEEDTWASMADRMVRRQLSSYRKDAGWFRSKGDKTIQEIDEVDNKLDAAAGSRVGMSIGNSS